MDKEHLTIQLEKTRLPVEVREYVEGRETDAILDLLSRYDQLMCHYQHILRSKFTQEERNIILQSLWSSISSNVYENHIARWVWDFSDGVCEALGLTQETRTALCERLCELSLVDNSAILYAAANANSVFFAQEDISTQ